MLSNRDYLAAKNLWASSSKIQQLFSEILALLARKIRDFWIGAYTIAAMALWAAQLLGQKRPSVAVPNFIFLRKN